MEPAGLIVGRTHHTSAADTHLANRNWGLRGIEAGHGILHQAVEKLQGRKALTVAGGDEATVDSVNCA